MPPQSPENPSDVDRDRLLSDTFVVTVEHHDVLGSTNDRAKSLAREIGVELPALVLADQQTAGRGRGANRWWTGPGSLAFTLLVNTSNWDVSRERMPLVALVAGIALVESVTLRLDELHLQPRLGLHWPNDVYLGNRKLAGILVEVLPENRLVVGVGVNTNCRLVDAPVEIRGRVATMLDATGEVQDHMVLLVDWLRGWEKWIAVLLSHPAKIGRRADALCLQRGQTLRIRAGRAVDEGRCLGIASDGALRLETASGIREFRSGTIAQ